jgi:RNA polymerase sigma-70 factor (ECF subfamily)
LYKYKQYMEYCIPSVDGRVGACYSADMSYKFVHTLTVEKSEVLQKLFIEHGKSMLYIAWDILHDIHLAEDAVQIAFKKLLNSRFEIDSISDNRTQSFLIIIVKNVALGIYKKRKREIAVEDELINISPDNEYVPIDILISEEDAHDVYTILGELDPKYADVLMMKYISDYTNREIANLLDISEQLVRVRLFRAKQAMLARLKKGQDQLNG